MLSSAAINTSHTQMWPLNSIFSHKTLKKKRLIPGLQLEHEMNLQHLVTPENAKLLIITKVISKDSRLAKHGTLKHQSL